MMDEILSKFGLKYGDLEKDEKETLKTWMEALSKSELNLEKVREYLSSMRSSVEQELTKVGHNTKEDIFMKARLRNYMLLEAFLSTPERAKKAIEQALMGMVK